jgi:hypothetical protein
MTIACCYVSPEGVVFGADSTTSYGLSDGPHYLNHAQKLFEIGEESTLAVIFWGLAGVGTLSYRTLIAELDDDLRAKKPATVLDVMTRWIAKFSSIYDAALMGDPGTKATVDRARSLATKPPFERGAPKPNPDARSESEENELISTRSKLTVGFCIGGYVAPGRRPEALFVHFEPHVGGPPKPNPIDVNGYGFWGAPNMIQRLVFGADEQTKLSILNSGKWNGDRSELDAVLAPSRLTHPILPLRDVIDFVHACIHSTIKALKFSEFSQVCGGPIELAVISTDRKFRWVRHKDWDAAVVDGDIS